uniref:Uncharacterized protein n=2 Tax=Cacopsylla melanoneura TaxID=428564 RepID=A0A8D8SH52_9HEMI
MRSHLLALLLFALAPSYSCSKRHFRGFDIWRNRVIGNGWDIAEKVIRGPGGFFWEPNPQNPTPPSLPPPLNEIVWCPGCFLERAYGTPKWSVDMSKVRRAPITLAEIPDEPPILHLRGFDIWKNRVIGNDWDIQENFIKGPGGFSWEKSKATDTPPSLPPPLNEIVWCPDCFLGKAYGRPTWSVDMSSFRREPTLVEPPNKQTINIPISYQRYLQFPWQQPYMAPQPPFFIPGMRPSQYNIIPQFVMSQFPFKGMSNSNPSIFQRPPYGIPFSPSNGNLLFMNPNEPNLNLELPSEDDEVLIPSEEIAPLPKDEAKLLNPYPGIESFPKYDPTLSAKQNNEAKLPSEGQTQTPKNEDKLLTSQPKTEIADVEKVYSLRP